MAAMDEIYCSNTSISLNEEGVLKYRATDPLTFDPIYIACHVISCILHRSDSYLM